MMRYMRIGEKGIGGSENERGRLARWKKMLKMW
jgi:hypothetical protein